MSLLAWHLRFDHEKDNGHKLLTLLAFLAYLVFLI